MAKKAAGGGAAKSTIKVALTLNLDQYAKALLSMRGETEAQTKALAGVFTKIGDDIAKKWFSAQAAVRTAESAIRNFTRTANELEKEGRRDDGTAAFSRLEAAASRLWESFVRGVLSLDSVNGAMSLATRTIEALDKSLPALLNLTKVIEQIAVISWTEIKQLFAFALGAAGDFVRMIGRKIEEIGGKNIGPAIMRRGVDMNNIANRIIDSAEEQKEKAQKRLAELMDEKPVEFGGVEVSAFKPFTSKIDTGSLGAKIVSDVKGRGAPELQQQIELLDPEAKTRFMDNMQGVVSSFQNSWIAGLENVADKMRQFSEKTKLNIFGLSEGVGRGMSDLIDSISMSAQMAIKVFGQSSQAAKIFEAVQLSVTGTVAAVKAVFALAKASDLNAEGQHGAAFLEIAAAAGYTSAAAMSGVAAANALSSSPGVGSEISTSPSTQAENFSRERRVVIVKVQNLVGNEEFVRETVIPEINRAAGEDVYIGATYASRSGALDPASRQ